eukprot:scaffold10650_cov169-Amphora_coffeaeformis.AAC.2
MQATTPSFDILWEGVQPYPLPTFALPIAGSIVKNNQEEQSQNIFENGRLIIGQAVAYGLVEYQTPNKAKVAVVDFTGSDISSRDVPFSYLVAENAPDGSYISGVVSPIGHTVNKPFGGTLGFELDQTEYNKYVVTFPGFATNPTVLLGPTWFTDVNERFPLNIGQVATAIDACRTNTDGDPECTLTVGADEESAIERLGFSILALGPELQNPVFGTVHGQVDLTAVDTTSTLNGEGWTSTSSYITINEDGKQSIGGGVEIKFAQPFDGIPSVYASAIVGEGNPCSPTDLEYESAPQFRLPSVVLERITEKSIFIKSLWVDTISSCIQPVPFYFAAIAPPKPMVMSPPVSAQQGSAHGDWSAEELNLSDRLQNQGKKMFGHKRGGRGSSGQTINNASGTEGSPQGLEPC